MGISLLLLCLALCCTVGLAAYSEPCGVSPYENTPVATKAEKYACFGEQMEARASLPHVIDASLYPQLPRIHVDDLNKPENMAYKQRTRPFILTGAMEGWPALQKWVMDPTEDPENWYLTSLFGNTVTDFYPYNMLKQGSHPYLFRFKGGLKETLAPTRDRFPFDATREGTCEEGCRYIHMQLTPKEWGQLEEAGDIPRKRHTHVEGDRWWMRRCLNDPVLLQEYHIKTHWKIILIGSEGAGMFNHTDSLQTGSWHGHVQGRKWWYVCGENEGPGPRMSETQCYESILHPGEVLYYGRNWWHHTRNLDTPTMTVTGTVVTSSNYDTVTNKLFGECARSSLSFDFSADLCDALDTCYDLWYERWRPGQQSPRMPWRQASLPDNIVVKEAINPKDSNYDGRNFIGE